MPKNLCFGVVAALAGLFASVSAHAQSAAADGTEKLRIVVVVRGEAALGRRQLSRSLRRVLADEFGGLRSSRAFRRALKELGIARKKQTYPRSLARAGKRIKADFVVFARIAENKKARKPDETIIARGYLISTETGKIVQRERVTYPALARAQRAGRTLATRLIAHLKPPNADRDGRVAEARGDPTDSAPAPASQPPRRDGPPAPLWAQPQPTQPQPAAPPPPDAGSPSTIGRPSAAVVASPNVDGTGFGLRIGLGIGAGIFRDYGLSSAAGDSALSYDLPPVLLVGLSIDYDLPTLGLGFAVRSSVRTIGFEIQRGEERLEPGGVLIDGRLLVDYRLALGEAWLLRPQIGVRWALTRIDDAPEALVLSSTALAPVIGARVSWGRQDGLQAEAGFDLGYIALYDETPQQTGDSPGGWAFGFDLGARYWFSPMLAVSVDGRFTVDQVGFSGPATRIVVGPEATDFRNASLLVVDTMIRMGAILAL